MIPSARRAAWLPVVALLGGVCAAPSPAAAADQHVLLVGDSITQGAAGDYTWRYRLWESLQAGQSPDAVDFVGDQSSLYNVVTNKQDGNHAYADPNFDQAHHATWARSLAAESVTLAPAVAAMPVKPTAIVVAMGTNDVSAGASRTLAALSAMVTRVRAVDPGVDVVVPELYPLYVFRSRSYANPAYVTAFNSGLAALAARLDTPDERVVTASTAGLDAATQTWDGRHPTPTGELTIAAAVAGALQGIGVGSGWSGPSAAEWPATAPAPVVVASGTTRANVRWAPSTPGALSYAIEERNETPGATGTLTTWTRVATYPQNVLSWVTAPLLAGNTYGFRITPIRGAMAGQAGPETTYTVGGSASTTPTPAPAPRTRPWWQWWW